MPKPKTMTMEGDSFAGSAQNAGPFNDVLHITDNGANGICMSSASKSGKRFIVEPQVLNAALELEERRSPNVVTAATFSSPLNATGGGLPPPPRPNSRKGGTQRSTPSSPATSGDHSHLASLPNSPVSSPYSNSPETPNNYHSGSIARSPRLSNIIRGDALLFSIRRQSFTEQDVLYDEGKYEESEPPSAGVFSPQWSSRECAKFETASTHGSLPSSPETPAIPVDGLRPTRQNRYLTGLQKITKLGKGKGSASAFSSDADGVRSARRMSDAELDARRKKGDSTSKGNEDLSSRYRRVLDKGVRTAGELMQMKGSTSVPSSPISPSENVVAVVGAEEEDKSGSGRLGGRGSLRLGKSGAVLRSPSATRASGPASGRETSPRERGGYAVGEARPHSTADLSHSQTQLAGPLSRLSHARRPSEQSSLSSLSPRPSLSPTSLSLSDSSYNPPSSCADPRISISSTIYPSSDNNRSFDFTRYPAPGRSSMSPDRESFIDLASPTFSPRAAEFQFAGIPPTVQRARSEQQHEQQPILSINSRKSSTDSKDGKSLSISSPSSPPSRSGATKSRLPAIIPSAGSDKPPVPTAPKPDFSYRSRSSANKTSLSHSKKPSPFSSFAYDLDPSLPTFSSSNALSPKERAERIRTTRKLAQVFGQPPGVSPISQEPQEITLPHGCMPIGAPISLNLNAKRKHHRPAVSMSDDVANTTPVFDVAGAIVWPPPEGTRYVSLAPRRHSAPLSPEEVSFMTSSRPSVESSLRSTSHGHGDGGDVGVIKIGSAEGEPSESSSIAASRRSSRTKAAQGPGSPTSFIDLSDEEGANDGMSEMLVETPKASRKRGQPFTPSTASLAESLTGDQVAEEERRRKREKLAKLHRFLGSRVPPHLVLGSLNEGAPLPPPAPSPFALNTPTSYSRIPAANQDEGEIRQVKMRRRRSSSAAEFSRKWSDDIDRLKEELNEREKAINVRRAVKMEKMFGVAPPQTLYHTRAPTSSTPIITTNVRQPSPKLSPRSPSIPPFRFTASASTSKTKSKKRPGTSDSAKPLIPNDGFLDAGQSSVYMHYRHSLNSLNDIIDRDDKESLAELHDYITGTGDLYSTGDQYDYQFNSSPSNSSNAPGALPHVVQPTSPRLDDFSGLITSTTRAERRRSLPSRVSIASFQSDISTLLAPTPTEGSFQLRRRRAAKLTHFFGVDYRDLMSEILESIEKGLEEERGKGTLKPDEVKDLQQKLVSLKTKRNSLSR